MKAAIILMVLTCMLIWPARSGVGQATGTRAEECSIIVDALQAAQRLKPGVARSQVEEDFELDGGISFPQQATYVYKKCRYIKIELSFGAEDITRRPNASPPPATQSGRPPSYTCHIPLQNKESSIPLLAGGA